MRVMEIVKHRVLLEQEWQTGPLAPGSTTQQVTSHPITWSPSTTHPSCEWPGGARLTGATQEKHLSEILIVRNGETAFFKPCQELILLNSTKPNVYDFEQIYEYVFHLQLTWHIDISVGDHLPREIRGKVSAVCLTKKLALVCQAAFYFASVFRFFQWSLRSDSVRFAKL